LPLAAASACHRNPAAAEDPEVPERDQAEQVVPVEDRKEEPLGVGAAAQREVPAREKLDPE
jgi:hypothetical protein